MSSVKFAVENPLFEWPEPAFMDSRIFISKMQSLQLGMDLGSTFVTDPNLIFKALETDELALVIVCVEDLKYPAPIQHVPFLCRLRETRLVLPRSGTAPELSLLVGQKNVFIAAVKKASVTEGSQLANFCSSFYTVPSINAQAYPELRIKGYSPAKDNK